jgi:methyl-accepting chemotaxis protein
VSVLRAEVGNLRRYEKDMVINLEDSVAVEKYRADWAKAHDRFFKAEEALGQLELDREARELIKLVEDGLKQYKAEMLPFMSKVGEKGFADPAEANKALGSA